jgi:F-type H+-transporting ATPase subunit alpha
MFDKLTQKFGEIGEVFEIQSAIAKVAGLPSVAYKEVVYFENGEQGLVTKLDKDSITVLLFGKKPVSLGTKVSRTGSGMQIKVSSSALGKIIDAFGEPILGEALDNKDTELRLIDTAPAGFEVRQGVTSQLITGISVIDTLFPLGKGQRELIVGNRKTGKSAFLTALIKGMNDKNTIVVYALVGGQKKEAQELLEFSEHYNLDRMVTVAAFAGEAMANIYFAPFSAMTYAEYFKDLGYDVLVILDDLTNHAKYCREISLLCKDLPGRDSYPPDIFYTHARLLERAGSFINDGKSATITCLPVAQTKDNDFTDYIVSNLIGITDGHLLFDEDEFSKGRRPAINYLLSVTRVGRQVQSPLLVDIGRRVLSFLSAEYAKGLSLSYFGSELTDFVRDILDKGQKLEGFFNERDRLFFPIEIQIVYCAMILENYFKGESFIKMEFYKDMLLNNYLKDSQIKKQIDILSNAPDYAFLVSRMLERKADLIDLCKRTTK